MDREKQEKRAKIKPVKRKKKLSTPVKIVLALFSLLLILMLGAGLLGLNLLNRLSRPDAPTVFAPDDEPSLSEPPVSNTPITPIPTPALPDATPTPMPLPLADVYEQTVLSPETLALLEQDALDERYVNILLVGVDRRTQKGNSRADTLMIATMDRVNGRLKLSSLLRDMLIDIPEHGYDKLNSSAAEGGVALLMETVNKNFHLNISEYVLVDFFMFEQIIDEMDGITVEMSQEEISAANDCIAGLNKQTGVSYLWDGFIFANPGNVLLTGKQALGYARIRHLDSDFVRTNRQFSVLSAVFAKFMQLNLNKQYRILDKLLPLVETNMKNARILDYMVSALSLKAKGLLHYRVPADGLYKNGRYESKSVLFLDVPKNAEALHEFIFRSVQKPKDAVVLTPGASLPPRTPTPSYVPYPGYTFDPYNPYDTYNPFPYDPGAVLTNPPEIPVTTPEPEPTEPVDWNAAG